MQNFNPMLMFDKNLSPQQLQLLQQMQVLLGGLGQPPAAPLSPSLGAAPPKTEIAQQRPILGGTING